MMPEVTLVSYPTSASGRPKSHPTRTLGLEEIIRKNSALRGYVYGLSVHLDDPFHVFPSA